MKDRKNENDVTRNSQQIRSTNPDDTQEVETSWDENNFFNNLFNYNTDGIDLLDLDFLTGVVNEPSIQEEINRDDFDYSNITSLPTNSSSIDKSQENNLKELQLFYKKKKYENKVKPRTKINLENVEVLEEWFCANLLNPYPSDEEKTNLAKKTNLTHEEVVHWIRNERRNLIRIQNEFEISKKPGSQNSTGKSRKNANQLEILNKCYSETPYPSSDIKKELERTTGLSSIKIKRWFENKRSSDKKSNIQINKTNLNPTPPSPDINTSTVQVPQQLVNGTSNNQDFTSYISSPLFVTLMNTPDNISQIQQENPDGNTNLEYEQENDDGRVPKDKKKRETWAIIFNGVWVKSKSDAVGAQLVSTKTVTHFWAKKIGENFVECDQPDDETQPVDKIKVTHVWGKKIRKSWVICDQTDERAQPIPKSRVENSKEVRLKKIDNKWVKCDSSDVRGENLPRTHIYKSKSTSKKRKRKEEERKREEEKNLQQKSKRRKEIYYPDSGDETANDDVQIQSTTNSVQQVLQYPIDSTYSQNEGFSNSQFSYPHSYPVHSMNVSYPDPYFMLSIGSSYPDTNFIPSIGSSYLYPAPMQSMGWNNQPSIANYPNAFFNCSVPQSQQQAFVPIANPNPPLQIRSANNPSTSFYYQPGNTGIIYSKSEKDSRKDFGPTN